VRDTSIPRVYNEPTVMWRMLRAGQEAHAVITPSPGGAVFAWFINGRQLGSHTFADWTDALLWSERMQAQNWAIGWRLQLD
jgi:hypothetical protein